MLLTAGVVKKTDAQSDVTSNRGWAEYNKNQGRPAGLLQASKKLSGSLLVAPLAKHDHLGPIRVAAKLNGGALAGELVTAESAA